MINENEIKNFIQEHEDDIEVETRQVKKGNNKSYSIKIYDKDLIKKILGGEFEGKIIEKIGETVFSGEIGMFHFNMMDNEKVYYRVSW